jgi:hypothetical protein
VGSAEQTGSDGHSKLPQIPKTAGAAALCKDARDIFFDLYLSVLTVRIRWLPSLVPGMGRHVVMRKAVSARRVMIKSRETVGGRVQALMNKTTCT